MDTILLMVMLFLSNGKRTVYKYLDGTPINVNDGNTWIMLQSINKTTAIN